MQPLFVSSLPLRRPLLAPRNALQPQTCVVMARKGNQKKKPRQKPSAPKSANQQASTPPPPPPSSEPFVPRGPTLRREYEDRGMIEPTYGPDAGVLPELVANRMIRRIAIFSGIPIALLTAFFAAYFVLKYKYDITVIPVVVAYSTLGTIALATGGITYGIFSCSWDDEPGSLLGFAEARTNFLRAKDGLLGQREREKREDRFERMDREKEQEVRAELDAKKPKDTPPNADDDNTQPPAAS